MTANTSLSRLTSPQLLLPTVTYVPTYYVHTARTAVHGHRLTVTATVGSHRPLGAAGHAGPRGSANLNGQPGNVTAGALARSLGCSGRPAEYPGPDAV